VQNAALGPLLVDLPGQGAQVRSLVALAAMAAYSLSPHTVRGTHGVAGSPS